MEGDASHSCSQTLLRLGPSQASPNPGRAEDRLVVTVIKTGQAITDLWRREQAGLAQQRWQAWLSLAEPLEIKSKLWPADTNFSTDTLVYRVLHNMNPLHV